MDESGGFNLEFSFKMNSLMLSVEDRMPGSYRGFGRFSIVTRAINRREKNKKKQVFQKGCLIPYHSHNNNTLV